VKNSLSSEVMRVALSFMEELDTPKSLAVAILLRHGEWEGVLSVKADPRNYLSTDAYRLQRDMQAVNFLKKFERFPTRVNLRRVALEKWHEGEAQCYRANARLQKFAFPDTLSGRDVDVYQHIVGIRKIVSCILGPRPPDLVAGRLGPGSTFSDRGRDFEITVPHKFSNNPSLTSDACWYLPQWLGTQWGSAVAARQGDLEFVRGNRFTTVPKDATKDRAIAAEPSINVFYQLAYGTLMKRRLKAFGWDMSMAKEIHMQVAREASLTREFATLDLSNASDTLCSELVNLLLPSAWTQCLRALRSPFTLIKSSKKEHWHRLEKFSSMGNGFTFELETIIFAAISMYVSRLRGHSGVLGVDVFVNGDDIIVKDDVFKPLKAVLEFFGFALNVDKTFFGSDCFRESCGGDFFRGVNVRSYYQKGELDAPEKIIACANGIRRFLQNGYDPNGSYRSKTWRMVLDCLPSHIRDGVRGPLDLGDIVIHDDRSKWSVRWRNGIRYVRVYRPARFRRVGWNFRPDVVLACATYGTGESERGVVPRNGVLGYKVGWVPFS